MSPHRCGSGLWGNLMEANGILITTWYPSAVREAAQLHTASQEEYSLFC